MSKDTEARKSYLSSQLDNAVVEEVTGGDLDEGYYRVFVPGGVREVNFVQAESKDEAKDKVKKLLESKIDNVEADQKDFQDKNPDGVQDGEVEVNPDDTEIKPSTKENE